MNKTQRTKLEKEMNSIYLPNKVTEPRYFVYALRLKSGKLYIGQSQKVNLRIAGHFNSCGGSVTRKDPPVKVEMITNVESKEKSLDLEKALFEYFNMSYEKHGKGKRKRLEEYDFPKEYVSKKELWEKYWWPMTQNDDIKAFTRYYNYYRKYQRGLHQEGGMR